MDDSIMLRLNIERYKALLEREKDELARRTIAMLLSEAEEQLRRATAQDQPRRSD
jgi:hypothetical protein